MLSSGKTIGVFQFEGFGMRESIKSLKPDCINDLIALSSLYRPGPMSNIPHYINRKHGKEEIEDIDPMVSDLLKETYGIMIYQEQVMELACRLAGYSPGEADLLRRAIGKKNKQEMLDQKKIFMNKAIENGVEENRSRKIFDLIEKFASYGFNKSHATAYSIISYQTAYLKAHYTVEFLVSLLNLDINDSDKIYICCEEAKSFNIKILKPSINKSDAYFSIEKDDRGKDSIRFGLCAIKGSGLKTMNLIVKEREANGIYKNIYDFVKRAVKLGLNKRALEGLVKSSALEEIDSNTGKLLHNIGILLQYGNSANKASESKQMTLFGENSLASENEIKLNSVKPLSLTQIIQLEYEALGFYLTKHPLEPYRKQLQKKYVTPLSKIEEQLTTKPKSFTSAGVIISKKVRSGKRGKFAFLQLSDESGVLDLSLFDENILAEKSNILNEGDKVICTLTGKKDDNGVRIIISDVVTVEEGLRNIAVNYTIFLKNELELTLVTTFLKNKEIHIAENNIPDNKEIADTVKLHDIKLDLYLKKYQANAVLGFENSGRKIVREDFLQFIEKNALKMEEN